MRKSYLEQNDQLNTLDKFAAVQKISHCKFFNLDKLNLKPSKRIIRSISQQVAKSDQNGLKLKSQFQIEKPKNKAFQIKDDPQNYRNSRIFSQVQLPQIKVREVENNLENIKSKLDEINEESIMPIMRMSYFKGFKDEENYSKKYKQIDKIEQQNKITQVLHSPSTLILQNQINQNILPSKLGICKNQNQTLKLNNLQFGDQYINAFAEGIQQMVDVQELRLDKNRITEQGADKLLQKLHLKMKSLNISKNQIGNLGCMHLHNYLQRKNLELIELNIEENKLTDNDIKLVLTGLINNRKLKILNISKNFITDQSNQEICNLINTHQNLRELYLHWNKIGKIGGFNIFDQLIGNEILKVLDISWNEIGGNQSAFKIQEFLKKNNTLVHLDLSNNHFDYNQSIQISQALESNFSLIGFHFAGHYGNVDQRGFLIINQQKESLQHPRIQRIQGVKPINLKKNQRYQHVPDQQFCWICDGWNQQKFQWTFNDHPVFLHLEFEGFEGKYMCQQNIVNRVVPNQEFEYFFTVDDEQLILENQPNNETILEQIDKIKVQDQIVDMIIQQKNIKQFNQFQNIFDDYYELQISVLPRQKQEIYIKPYEIIKKKWNLKNSIFKDWKKVTEELIQNCFEFDWSNNRIYRIIKNPDDLQLVRNHFKQHYLEYLECYKCYSVLFPIGDIYAITITPYTLFVNQTNMIDQYLTLNDMNLKWAATTQSMIKKDKARNPERGIVRYQFIEVLTRLAEQKYCFSNQCNNYHDAVEKMYNDCLKPELERCSSQKWRTKRYWNEDCEKVIIKYKTQLENIYQNLLKRRLQIKNIKNHLMVEDALVYYFIYQEMNKSLDPYSLSERDIQESMIQSLMVQIDELNYDRHTYMTIIEFYEFIARCADKFYSQKLNYQDIDQYKDSPLHQKLENFIILLKQKILETQNEVKENKNQIKKSKLGSLLKEHQNKIKDLVDTKLN